MSPAPSPAPSERPLALVTGASGGIGLELARAFAADGYDLALVARSADKLRELAADLEGEHGIAAHVFPADLTDRGAPDALAADLGRAGLRVDALVNNAGFATYGAFAELPLERELDEIQLNVTAPTHLAKLFLPGMLERGRGRVLNVASTAAFFPGPLMAVYYATKNYLLALTEALAEEVRGRGVTVSALCPGPTESGFQARADMEDSKLVQQGLMSAREVAEAGYRGLERGETVIVPGARNRLLVELPRILPRRVVARTVRRNQERAGR